MNNEICNPQVYEKLFFLHVPKTGGYSINSWLQQYFPSSEIQVNLEITNWTKQDFWKSAKCISGHLPFQILNRHHPLNEYLKVTVLREPIDQLLSHLRMVRRLRNPENKKFWPSYSSDVQDISLSLNGLNFLEPLDIAKWLEDCPAPGKVLFHNCQTRYFLRNPNDLFLNELHADEALLTLSRFDVIGALKHIDEFGENVAQRMGWSVLKKIEKKNVSPKTDKPFENFKKFRKALEPFVYLDQEIYTKACNQFFGSQNI